MRALEFAGIVGGDDIGMIQLSGRFDLSLKSPETGGIFEDAGGNHLQGDFTFHRLVASLKDLPHAALAKLFQHNVTSDHQAAGFSNDGELCLKQGESTVANKLFCERFGRYRFKRHSCHKQVDLRMEAGIEQKCSNTSFFPRDTASSPVSQLNSRPRLEQPLAGFLEQGTRAKCHWSHFDLHNFATGSLHSYIAGRLTLTGLIHATPLITPVVTTDVRYRRSLHDSGPTRRKVHDLTRQIGGAR